MRRGGGVWRIGELCKRGRGTVEAGRFRARMVRGDRAVEDRGFMVEQKVGG